MSLTSVVFTLCGVFGLYWLIAAFSAKRASGRGIAFPPGLLILGAAGLAVFLVIFTAHLTNRRPR